MEKLRTRAFASRTSGIISAILLALVVVGVDSTDRLVPESSFVPGEPSPVSIRLPSTGYLRSSPAARVKVRFEYERFILRKGEAVPDRAAEKYKLLQSTLERRHDLLLYRIVGVFLVTFLLGFLLSEALRRSWPGNRRYLRTEISIYVLIAVLVICAKPVFALTSWPVYLVPAAAGPIVVSYYRGRRLGVYVTLFGAFLLSLMLELDPVAFIVFFIQGLSVIPFLRPSRKFRPIFVAAGVSTIAGLVALFGMSTALTGAREITAVVDWQSSSILAVIAGGLLSGPLGWILALAIRPLLGIVSQSKLNDLQALQHPLLKRLQQQAPGTWEHSRAIANLAEEAASKIEADALLVRVGSYFHDLGKAINPNLFVENQEFDDEGKPISPHDDLSPEKSASLIVDHVVQGVQILRNNGIPEGVVEFAYMHHGSSVVEYFWNKYREECKEKGIEKPELTRRAFTYPGIPPQSSATGIMMLADAVEATSRTVTDPTLENFKRVVNRIVFTKLGEGQLDESGLTIRSLKVVAQSFAESLHFSRHKRVKYQWQVKEEDEDQAAEEAAEEASMPSVPPAERESRPSSPTEDGPSGDLDDSIPPAVPERPSSPPVATAASELEDTDPPSVEVKIVDEDEPPVRKAKTSTLTGIGTPVSDKDKDEMKPE
jgi:putative nucleotidyltransferase with HDIG domain